jgi:hypothetical protein
MISKKKISSNIKKNLGGHGATLKKFHETFGLSNNIKKNLGDMRQHAKNLWGMLEKH